MDNERLREKLEELHLELLQMAPAEKSIEDKRDALATKIQATLSEEDLGGFHVSLMEDLQKEILVFEQDHPRIAKLLGGMI